MATLREFLIAKAHKPNQIERRKRRDDWVAAVKRLMAQLQDWLREADAEGYLDITKIPIEKHEESIGTYVVHGLEIRSDEAVVRVLPVGYGVLRPGFDEGMRVEGRVDITNGTEKFILYRLLGGRNEQWIIGRGDLEHPKMPKLNQTRFEDAMQELLS